MQVNTTNTNSSSVPVSPSTSALNSKQDAKLRAACKGMEAMFLNMLLTEMRKAVPPDPLLGQSNQQDIMQSMLDSEMTKNMSQAGGVGLADMLYRQLSPQVAPAVNKDQTSK